MNPLAYLIWLFTRSWKPVVAIIIAGQSNAVNEAPEGYTPRNYGIYSLDINTGVVSQARDPLPGIERSGAGLGSFLIPMADALMSTNKFGGVVLVPCAVANTFAEQWATPEGVGGKRCTQAVRRAKAAGLNIRAVLWQHGEADSSVSTGAQGEAAAYAERVIAARNISYEAGLSRNVPWYVPLETYVYGRPSVTIRAAQGGLALAAGFAPGPDFDQLNDPYRMDNLHFNGLGARTAGAMWANVLKDRL